MASVYDLKPKFQALLRPFCRALARAGVTANQVTVAGILVSAAAGLAVLWRPESRWPLLVFPAALLLRMALNAIDGMLAREHGMKSPLGAILNEVGDVVSDAVLYLPLAVVPGIAPWLLVPVVVLAATAEMTGVVAVQIGGERRYDGPMGKSDRALAFGLITTMLGIGVAPGLWLDGMLAVVLALSVATVVNRARKAVSRTTQR
jgi:CDP-diacylglycerol--glycerol-3-phosphate 3-phosphatidyltransferase